MTKTNTDLYCPNKDDKAEQMKFKHGYKEIWEALCNNLVTFPWTE